MKILRILLIITLVIAAAGCEKPIDFNLDQSDARLVVEATIENGQPPIVILSQSLNYFSNISPQVLASSFVNNADVFLSNSSKTQKLKEYSYKAGSLRYNSFNFDMVCCIPLCGSNSRRSHCRLLSKFHSDVCANSLPMNKSFVPG